MIILSFKTTRFIFVTGSLCSATFGVSTVFDTQWFQVTIHLFVSLDVGGKEFFSAVRTVSLKPRQTFILNIHYLPFSTGVKYCSVLLVCPQVSEPLFPGFLAFSSFFLPQRISQNEFSCKTAELAVFCVQNTIFCAREMCFRFGEVDDFPFYCHQNMYTWYIFSYYLFVFPPRVFYGSVDVFSLRYIIKLTSCLFN